MSNTIIGRVKSFKDYWIHLKGYYWSIQLEIAVWIYWIHLKGLYWRIHLEIAVWILDNVITRLTRADVHFSLPKKIEIKNQK